MNAKSRQVKASIVKEILDSVQNQSEETTCGFVKKVRTLRYSLVYKVIDCPIDEGNPLMIHRDSLQLLPGSLKPEMVPCQ